MSDYLIDRYNSQVNSINIKEAERLHEALTIYTTTLNRVLEDTASERLEAGITLAAAMAQRDHEYKNGKPDPQKSEADKLIDTMN